VVLWFCGAEVRCRRDDVLAWHVRGVAPSA